MKPRAILQRREELVKCYQRPTNVAGDVREALGGLRYVTRHWSLRGLAISYSLYQASWGILLVAVPVYAARELGVGLRVIEVRGERAAERVLLGPAHLLRSANAYTRAVERSRSIGVAPRSEAPPLR